MQEYFSSRTPRARPSASRACRAARSSRSRRYWSRPEPAGERPTWRPIRPRAVREASASAREQDLLLHLPLRYEDETRHHADRRPRPGRDARRSQGEVVRSEVSARGRRSAAGRAATTAPAASRCASCISTRRRSCNWRRAGACARIGEVRGGLFGAEMVHPRYRIVAEGERRCRPGSRRSIRRAAGIGQAGLRGSVLRGAARMRLGRTRCRPAVRRAAASCRRSMAALRLLHQPPAECRCPCAGGSQSIRRGAG